MDGQREAKKVPPAEQQKPEPTTEPASGEVIEDEVGGEGPVDVVATRERARELESERGEEIAREDAARAAARRADEGKRTA